MKPMTEERYQEILNDIVKYYGTTVEIYLRSL
jgi:hypothetical protein